MKKERIGALIRFLESVSIGWIVHLFNATRYSASGFRACFKDGISFQQECALAIPHFLAVLLLPLSVSLRLYLTAIWFVVIAAELMNTALEAVTDLASPGKHELAKKAKDCGSAAVFCVLVLFCVSWTIVIIRLF